MNRLIMLACEPKVVSVSVSSILPVKKVGGSASKSPKYQTIAASIAEVGIIEPLVVFPQDRQGNVYLLLDGHIRLEIAKQLGHSTVDCLIANDDEAFTYNHKVNHLPAIQEHFMIRRAIEDGVPEERIARTLNIDVASICKKRDLLEGICPEAVQLLKDKPARAGSIREMRKVKPLRQIEMAELMKASNNYSVTYVKCLLAATPQDELTDSEKAKEVAGLTPQDIARIEHEMESLQRDFLTIEESHGKNTLNLVIVVGYLRKLLDNARVVRFLSQNHPEILTEFQKLVESRSLPEMATEE